MLDSFQIDSSAVSDRGLNEKRPHNEDSYLEMPERGIFAVADGVGGAEAGEVASQMAVEILAEAFANNDELSDAEDVMRQALERANAAIYRMANDLPQLASMATTIVALHVAGNIATIGHAGDSRLYRLDGDGSLFRETEDHSMVAEEVRAGRMTAEQAENHPGKNIISRALGAEPEIVVDLKTIMVGPDTSFLICSDGVTRHISDGEIAELLRADEHPGVICGKIKGLCYERGAEDNLTAVIVRLSEAGQGHRYPPVVQAAEEADETTVATARSYTDPEAVTAAPPDGILELETAELSLPANSNVPSPPVTAESTHPDLEQAGRHISEDDDYVTATSYTLDQQTIGQNVEKDGPVRVYANETRPSTVGRIAGSVGLLLLGSLIGLGGYHYFLANRTVSTVAEPITEMRSTNPQLTAFEDNRRAVDKEPEAALKVFVSEPKDSQNLFLVGRAYLLLGKFPEAHKAFVEARDLIDGEIAQGSLDPLTGQTIKTDIAIAVTVTNDTGVQKILRTELDRGKTTVPPAPAANGGGQAPSP